MSERLNDRERYRVSDRPREWVSDRACTCTCNCKNVFMKMRTKALVKRAAWSAWVSDASERVDEPMTHNWHRSFHKLRTTVSVDRPVARSLPVTHILLIEKDHIVKETGGVLESWMGQSPLICPPFSWYPILLNSLSSPHDFFFFEFFFMTLFDVRFFHSFVFKMSTVYLTPLPHFRREFGYDVFKTRY